MDDLDEEFVEIIAAVGPRRRGQIVAAARALAGDIRADADQLGTAAIHPRNRTRLKVLGLLPQQTFGQSRFWRYQLAAPLGVRGGHLRHDDLEKPQTSHLRARCLICRYFETG